MIPIVPPSSVSSLANTSGIASGSNAPQLKSSGDSAGGFSKLIDNFVQNTNTSQHLSDQSINDLVQGKTDNVQQVVLAVANAEMSFQLFMEIRNKLIESYNELMRMQF